MARACADIGETMSFIAGIDEAGRGPMIGPMVVAIVAFPEEKLGILRNLKVRDSKRLMPPARKRLASLITRMNCIVEKAVAEPQLIDCAVRGECYKNLNHLEAAMAAELINRAASKTPLKAVYIDSPDPAPERFAEAIKSLLKTPVDLVVENKADEKYVIVGAASIIAKVERDSIIDELKKIYGDFGSGYPSDPKTKKFAIEWLEKNREPPPIARKEWGSWKRLL